jgi:fatty acid-binding protein DegV
MVDGEVEPLERVRTTARARERVIELLEERVATLSRPGVAVAGLRIPWFIDSTASLLRDRHPDLAMTIGTSLSAALTVHGGPGSFVVAVADLPPTLG